MQPDEVDLEDFDFIDIQSSPQVKPEVPMDEMSKMNETPKMNDAQKLTKPTKTNDPPKNRRWSQGEDTKLIELYNIQQRLVAEDPRKQLAHGKMWELISSQMQEVGYKRSADSCRVHFYLNSWGGGQEDENSDSDGPRHRKRKSTLRDDFVRSDSGNFKELIEDGQRLVKKPRPVFKPTAAIDNESGSTLNLNAAMVHAPPALQTPTGTGLISPVAMANSIQNTQSLMVLQVSGNKVMTPNTLAGQLEMFDRVIHDLKNTKASLTSKLSSYQTMLADLPNMIKEKQDELDRVNKEINDKENGKQGYLSFMQAFGGQYIG